MHPDFAKAYLAAAEEQEADDRAAFTAWCEAIGVDPREAIGDYHGYLTEQDRLYQVALAVYAEAAGAPEPGFYEPVLAGAVDEPF